MKIYTITPTAITGRTGISKTSTFRLSDTTKTIICFAVLFLIYATVDGLADVFFGGML